MSQSEAERLAQEAVEQAEGALSLAQQVLEAVSQAATSLPEPGGSFLLTGLMVLMLAIFVGYHVVWSVTPALHSPLMAVTNAVSSVIIVGAIIAAGPEGFSFAKLLGFLAVTLASVNIFGGFLVTKRMLSMFKRRGG